MLGGLDRRGQSANIATQAKHVLGADHLDVVADRGYFSERSYPIDVRAGPPQGRILRHDQDAWPRQA